jgi:ABC-type glycerol-3-phosphate transport system permease component
MKNQVRKIKENIFYIVLFVVLFLYVVSMLTPMAWGIITALKTQQEFRINVLGLPKGAPWEWQWGNFIAVTDGLYTQITTEEGRFYVGFFPSLVNTLTYAGGGALIRAIVPCVIGYVTAKFDYKFSRFINTMVIVLMTIPIVGSTPSELQILQELGLYDTMIGNFIQKFNFLGMYYLVYYATFKSLSNDFAEAAYVDGASEFRVMVQIVVPMVANIIGTVFLLHFIDFWNDYQTPLLYLPSYATIARSLFAMSQRSQGDFATVPFRMAGCLLLALPILVLFLIFKEKLMGNLSMGGVKE